MQNTIKNIAIIPARGGSKRIPGKNVKDFLGKPIIAWSIEAAVKSGLFSEVMVSTDSQLIAEIAVKYGAVVPFIRSAENSNDFASLADVVDEVKQAYLKLERSFDFICCILPTAPLILRSNIKNSYGVLLQENADSIRPVVRFSYPIQRAFKMSNHKLEMFNPEHLSTRSQDLEPAFHDAGQFYWMKYSSGLRGQIKLGFEIPETQSQDIDSDEDWKIAELKYNYLKANKLISQ